MSKVLFSIEDAYLIRSNQVFVDGSKSTSYYETPVVWNNSPACGTIFRDYDAASAHLNMLCERDRAPKGWADGRTETFDIVTLFAEIEQIRKAAKP